MSVGSLVAFLSYFTLILIAVMMGTFVAIMAPRAAVCAERIQAVLDTPTSVPVPTAPVGALREPGSVELRDVTFGYPGAASPVLSGISLRSLVGQTTAVIGSTAPARRPCSTSWHACSTRRADPCWSAASTSASWTRTCCGTASGSCPRSPYLFSGTVATNLRYGKPDATDEELWEALEVAQARDFVAAMPDGLDGAIAQGRVERLRGAAPAPRHRPALVRKPDVYLFDDSFSRSTSPPTPGCALPCTRTPAARPCSSSPSASPPSPTPTRSWCWRTVRRRSRHPRRAARRMPDLRRDRRLPGDGDGGGMSHAAVRTGPAPARAGGPEG
jgi:ATP-binding cassette subfamily B protein